MPSQTQDDGFHEIQLNGKQLVFLFMAATVVSVVIFLCGVLVGRGVRAERGDAAAASDTSSADLLPAPADSGLPASAPVDADPRAAAPPAPADDLSYFNRLEQPDQPVEALKPAPALARESERPASPPQPVTPAAQIEPTSAAPPPGAGYAVQIAALNNRNEADAMARRLTSKGYAAYVLAPATGTPAVFRVRIGTFKTRREAETMAAKLQKEEQFKPWVTR